MTVKIVCLLKKEGNQICFVLFCFCYISETSSMYRILICSLTHVFMEESKHQRSVFGPLGNIVGLELSLLFQLSRPPRRKKPQQNVYNHLDEFVKWNKWQIKQWSETKTLYSFNGHYSWFCAWGSLLDLLDWIDI